MNLTSHVSVWNRSGTNDKWNWDPAHTIPLIRPNTQLKLTWCPHKSLANSINNMVCVVNLSFTKPPSRPAAVSQCAAEQSLDELKIQAWWQGLEGLCQVIILLYGTISIWVSDQACHGGHYKQWHAGHKLTPVFPHCPYCHLYYLITLVSHTVNIQEFNTAEWEMWYHRLGCRDTQLPQFGSTASLNRRVFCNVCLNFLRGPCFTLITTTKSRVAGFGICLQHLCEKWVFLLKILKLEYKAKLVGLITFVHCSLGKQFKSVTSISWCQVYIRSEVERN